MPARRLEILLASLTDDVHHILVFLDAGDFSQLARVHPAKLVRPAVNAVRRDAEAHRQVHRPGSGLIGPLNPVPLTHVVKQGLYNTQGLGQAFSRPALLNER